MWSPHFETELELMANHLDQGDEVYVVVCRGELPACFTNPCHKKIACLVCYSKLRQGLSILGRKVTLVRYSLDASTIPLEIPEKFANIEELKTFQIGPLQLGLCAASSLITRINREHRLDTIKYSGDVRKELRSAYYVYKCFQKILMECRPDRVYVFNGRFSTTLPVINACESASVKYFTHERGGGMTRYLLLENAIVHDIEYATKDMNTHWESLPGLEALKRGSTFFEDRRKQVEHSWLSFTKGQEAGKLPPGFDKRKQNIGIFNSTIEEYAAIRTWPNPIRVYVDEVDAISQITGAFIGSPEVHFYLRVHPNLKGYDNSQTREIAELAKRISNLTVISPESTIDSYALMENCSSIVTFGSTMGAEACFWGKPTILLGRAFYETQNVAYIPRNHAEVIDLLKNLKLEPKPKYGAIKYGFWELERGIIFKRYLPKSLFSGEFMGKAIRPSFRTRLLVKVLRAFSKLIH